MIKLPISYLPSYRSGFPAANPKNAGLKREEQKYRGLASELRLRQDILGC